MENSKVSPALTKIEARIKELKDLEKAIDQIDFSIVQARNRLESLDIDRDEAYQTKRFLSDRISALVNEAEDEGFTRDYIDRFLKEHKYSIIK